MPVVHLWEGRVRAVVSTNKNFTTQILSMQGPITLALIITTGERIYPGVKVFSSMGTTDLRCTLKAAFLVKEEKFRPCFIASSFRQSCFLCLLHQLRWHARSASPWRSRRPAASHIRLMWRLAISTTTVI